MYEKDWGPTEKATVDRHRTTSADNWAIVCMVINDSKWRTGELSSTVQFEDDTEELLRDVMIHLQITGLWRQQLIHEVPHYESSARRTQPLYVWAHYILASQLEKCVIQLDSFNPAAPSTKPFEYTCTMHQALMG